MNDSARQRELMASAKNESVGEALSNERRDFLAVLNHRLRTPILAVQRAAILLLHGDFGPLEPAQEEILSLVKDNANELDRLLSMLIDIYKYKNKSKSLSITSAHLDEFIHAIAAKMADHAKAHNIELSVSYVSDCDMVNVAFDRQELEKAVSHLVENAIKHARSRVVLRGAIQDGGGCIIEVEDDGKGMSGQDISNLFDRFYLMSTQGKYPAFTGTGLCLCSEICKAHGGQISCPSTSEQGTSFLISLPGNAVVAAAAQALAG